jgi:hypothetical protein
VWGQWVGESLHSVGESVYRAGEQCPMKLKPEEEGKEKKKRLVSPNTRLTLDFVFTAPSL